MLSASVPPPSSRVEENDSLVLRCGALVGLSAVAALVCAVPAMMRVSAALPGDAPTLRAWAALGATTLGPMGLAVVALRGARQGLRAFVEPLTALRLFGIGLWMAALFVALAVLGSVLSATTHHHALAGVTYAFGALALAVALGLVCARVVTLLQGLSNSARRMATMSIGTAVLGLVLILSVRFLSVASKDPGSAEGAATVVDVLAFAFTALFASRDWRGAQRPLAIVGPPVAVFVASLGITTLRDPPVHQVIVERAPVFVAAADLISGR